MSAMGSTRVFGNASGIVVIGLRRRPARDLYHWLVTGPWRRLVIVFVLVHFATVALLGLAQLAVAGQLPSAHGALGAVVGAVAPATPAPALSARAIAAGAVAALDGFVRWAEVVIAAGIVLAKFSLARARVLFSNVAVVGPHGNGTALMFRMANERSSHLVDARVSAMLVWNEVVEGEVVRRAHDLALARDVTALFSHAWTAIHPISRGSPLAGESARSLEGSEAEIIVNISGFDEGLAQTVHARHVYPAGRVRWGAQFREIVVVRPDGTRAIDYRKFHKTVQAPDAAPPDERTPARRAR